MLRRQLIRPVEREDQWLQGLRSILRAALNWFSHHQIFSMMYSLEHPRMMNQQSQHIVILTNKEINHFCNTIGKRYAAPMKALHHNSLLCFRTIAGRSSTNFGSFPITLRIQYSGLWESNIFWRRPIWCHWYGYSVLYWGGEAITDTIIFWGQLTRPFGSLSYATAPFSVRLTFYGLLRIAVDGYWM